MKWFRTRDRSISIETGVWEDALKDVEDLEKMAALGLKVYTDCLREAGCARDRGVEMSIVAFAHIIHHMADNMDGPMMDETVWLLEEGWRMNETTFWESPALALQGYRPMVSGDDATPLIIERVGMDLLSVVRPNLMRLVWAMLVADGRAVGPHDVELADRGGGSMIVPMALLNNLLAEGAPDMLDEEETKGMSHLANILALGPVNGVSTDELLQAVLGRRYMLDEKGVFLWPYLSSGNGVHLGPTALKKVATNMVQVISALTAFKVMLVAMVMGEHGALSVTLPERPRQRKKKSGRESTANI
ncbi:MAG: hypothetical protein HPY73_05325 [Methanomassiliicoccales archaeon]|nr:MAG: hypothetical protein HPY73_05325 [Methanomassiliicoccales archaeon]